MLIIKELNDWHPRVAVIHVITKARSINDSETDYEKEQRLELAALLRISFI